MSTVRFTISQLELYALSQTRYWDVYVTLRASAHWVAHGQHWGPEGCWELASKIHESGFWDSHVKDLASGCEFSDFADAHAVHVAMELLKRKIHESRTVGANPVTVRQARNDLVKALRRIQW